MEDFHGDNLGEGNFHGNNSDVDPLIEGDEGLLQRSKRGGDRKAKGGITSRKHGSEATLAMGDHFLESKYENYY